MLPEDTAILVTAKMLADAISAIAILPMRAYSYDSIYCRIVPRNSFPSLEKDINAILWQVPERRSVIAVGKPTNEIVNLLVFADLSG